MNDRSDTKAVAEAVAGFYAALNTMFKGDLGPMLEVWSHADDVTYMGPTVGSRWAGTTCVPIGRRKRR